MSNSEQLDISVKEMKNIVTSEMKAETFMTMDLAIDEKYDGTKLTLVRNGNPYNSDYKKNWIVAYKGNIIYPSEFKNLDPQNIEKSSIGISQYRLVFDMLEKASPRLRNIPTDTEFLVEFVMDKPTLTRTYNKKHSMILVGYSPTTILSAGNRLRTSPEGFQVQGLEQYAKALGIAVPARLFSGKLVSLPKGLSSLMMPTYERYSGELDRATTYTDREKIIRKIFTDFNSSLGGKPEGVVIKDLTGIIIGKYVNDDQYSNSFESPRSRRKERHTMSALEESEYFAKLKKIANDTVSSMDKSGTLAQKLERLSDTVYNMDLFLVEHSKKDNFQKQDDLYLLCKKELIRKLPGNNWCVFQGRFQPPTKAHIDIIRKYANLYDGIYIVMVENEGNIFDNPFSSMIRMEILQKGLKGLENKYKIKTVKSGNLLATIPTLDYNINAIIGGTDRKEKYQEFAKKLDIKFIEIKRTDAGVSATKVRDSLFADDKNEFFKNMGFFDASLYNRMKMEMVALKPVATKEETEDLKVVESFTEFLRKSSEKYLKEEHNDLSVYDDIIKSHTIKELVYYDWNKVAFGISNDETIDIPISKIKIKWKDDMKNVTGSNMKKYFNNKSYSKLPPVDVSFDGKNYYLEDGHHRYGYAKELKLKSIPVNVTITANPFKILGFTIDDVIKYKEDKSLQT